MLAVAVEYAFFLQPKRRVCHRRGCTEVYSAQYPPGGQLLSKPNFAEKSMAFAYVPQKVVSLDTKDYVLYLSLYAHAILFCASCYISPLGAGGCLGTKIPKPSDK